MKKIFLLVFCCLFMLSGSVFADGVTFNFVGDPGSLTLEVYNSNNENITYDDAVSQYGIDRYLELYYASQNVYFYNGNEISHEEYIVGHASEVADETAEGYQDEGIRVHNTDEVIKAIDDIYTSYKNCLYHLVYSTEECNNIDFEAVENHIADEYLSPIEQNAYKYEEYGIRQPLKYFPNYNETEMIIDGMTLKITEDENSKLERFVEEFDKYFVGKSDYEKILGVYIYLSNNTVYVEDTGYTNFVDGLVSPYDVLLEGRSVCIGMATTFQYLMESLGIESYIIDVVSNVDEDEKLYSTIHTYNAVRLDNKWYIIDIPNSNSFDGFLLGKNSANYRAEDFAYAGIEINEQGYLDEYPDATREFSFDYDSIDKLIADIKGENTQERVEDETPIEEEDDTDFLAFVLLGLILVVVFLVIIIFTRKKRA